VITGSLAGLVLVVTRPAAQAGPFIAMATAAGAECIALPTLDIKAIPLAELQLRTLTETRWDWAIYTSANAVLAASAHIPLLRTAQVAAVGGATARALAALGVGVQAVPAGRADSEGLLQLPVFTSISAQHILILKGAGGRDLLQTQLNARGAHVCTLELYRRTIARPDPAALERVHEAVARGARVVVLATSVEILVALLQIAPSADLEALRSCPLVVPGARVAANAAQRGWHGNVTQAVTAEDSSMLEAVLAAAGAAPHA
jgi:uroporphyrinogen-III synthase